MVALVVARVVVAFAVLAAAAFVVRVAGLVLVVAAAWAVVLVAVRLAAAVLACFVTAGLRVRGATVAVTASGTARPPLVAAWNASTMWAGIRPRSARS